jgi:CTP synthase
MRLTGVNPMQDLVEIVEVPDHPWMLGGQFHPEFKSRPNRAQPLFRDFIGAAIAYHGERQAGAKR